MKWLKGHRYLYVAHLDHATKIDDIQKAIDAGFSSVMIDGSQLSYEKNVEITRNVVARAKKRGVSVEAEIGSVAYSGSASHRDVRSDPEETARFVNDSGIDAVAVAVGTLHRMDHQASHIDFDLLSRISQAVTIPLVHSWIHRSCGRGYRKMRNTAVCKVNIGTALRIAFSHSLRKTLNENPDDYVYSLLLAEAQESCRGCGPEQAQAAGILIREDVLRPMEGK